MSSRIYKKEYYPPLKVNFIDDKPKILTIKEWLFKKKLDTFTFPIVKNVNVTLLSQHIEPVVPWVDIPQIEIIYPHTIYKPKKTKQWTFKKLK